MLIHTWNGKKDSVCRWGFIILVATMGILTLYQNGSAAGAKQKTFKSADEAVKAFVEAVKADDTKQLGMIFGPAAKEIITSGDEAADKAGRERFIKSYGEMNKLVKDGEKKVVLHVGSDDWPFPIPLVKKGESWFFDTKAGKQEILQRRIGRNELNTIQVCQAYVDAQREYASKDWDGNGLFEYAEKFMSEKGKKDGLHWEAKGDEEQSPVGPLVARAVKEGDGGEKSGGKPVPYHGYYFKMLKGQAGDAPGGTYDYVVKGKMIGGFGLLAYPADYGVSGVMTFMVSHHGVVYEKDLGKETEKAVKMIKKYNPDKTWKRVE